MFGVPLHSLAVHFPIALALAAFLYDGWAVYAKEPRFHELGSSLSKLAAVSALIAFATGLALAGMRGLGSRSTVTGHALLGLVSTIALVALAFSRQAAEARAGRAVYRPVWLAVEGVAAFFVATTAIVGHRI